MAVTQAMGQGRTALPPQADLEQMVRDALAYAQRRGADAAEARASVSAGLSVNVRMREVDTLEYQRDRGFAITVYFGQRKGSASSADFSSAAINATVEAACTIARYTSEDEYQGLADAGLMARDIPDLDLYHPWALDADAAIELARECEGAALDADARIVNSDGAEVSTHGGVQVYGNTHGFCAGYRGSRHGVTCVAVARQDEEMQRDYWFSVAREASALEAPAQIGAQAAARAIRRLGARRLGTMQVPVLYAPQVARGIIGHFLGAVRGGAQYRKASFLLDSLNTPVFAEHVQLEERPYLPRALGSAPFDGEGVAPHEGLLVADGVLRSYLLDSYSARKLGMQPTGHAGGVHNLLVHPGNDDFDALVRRMGRGLIVTELMGQGVNMVTGDYSRGASGFWVEDGAVVHPVQEITVAGNLRDMLRNIVAIGSDVDTRGNVHTGSILVEGMTIAGE